MVPFDTKLAHKEFFENCLDLEQAGMEDLRAAVAKGDFEACEGLFLDLLRNTLRPELVLQRHNFIPGNQICYPTDTIFDIANRIMNNTFLSVGIPHTFENGIQYAHNPTPDQYMEWTWQLNRHHEWDVLVACYRQTGDEIYAKTFANLMREFIRQMPAPEGVHGGDTLGYRTIEIGIRLSGSWIHAVHAFLHSPSLTAHDWTVFFKSIYENAKRLQEHYTCGNWLLMEMNGLTHVGLLFPFFKEAQSWLNQAVDLLIKQVQVQIYDDGFQYELSTEYHQVVIINYLAVARLFQQFKHPVPQGILDVLEKLYGLYPKLVSPLGVLPDLNDGRQLDIAAPMAAALELFPHRDDFRYFATRKKEGSPPAFDCIHLPYSGMAVFRSGWTQEDLWCFFEAAPFGFGHQHEDKLNLLLYAFGKEMITEAGCNAYDGSVRHNYALSTQGHNAILVDGHTQCRRPHYNRNTIEIHKDAGLAYRNTDDFASGQGTFDEPFGEQATKVKHQRRVLYMKHPEYSQPYILVIDRLYGDGQSHTYDCLWHYTDHPYTQAKDTVTVDFGNQITLTTLTANYDKVAVVRGQNEPFQGWLASRDVAAEFPIPTAVLTKTTHEDVRLITLLAPCKGEPCPITAIVASDNVADTCITLHTASGEIELNETDYFAD